MQPAALVLPAFFVISARALGPRYGFESVAIAWAVGYPIAFVVLLLLVTYTIDLKVMEFVRQVVGVPLCILAAAAVGQGVKWAMMGTPLAVRLPAITVAIVGVAGVLLAYTQGLSPARARAALRGAPPPPPPADEPPAAAAPPAA